MNNQIQRIAELENEIEVLNHDREGWLSEKAELAAENEKLRRSLLAFSNPQNLTVIMEQKIKASVKEEVENFSRQFRDDVVKDVSNGILPYVKTAHDLCHKTIEKQGDLEERFERHRSEIAAVFDEQIDKTSELISSLSQEVVDAHQTGVKKWVDSYKKVEANLSAVNELASSLNENMKQARQSYENSKTAARQLSELFVKLKGESEKASENMQRVRDKTEESVIGSINRIESRFEDTGKNFKKSVYVVSAVLAFGILAFTFMTAGAVSGLLNKEAGRSISEMNALIKEEKSEVRSILRNTIEEAREDQIANEAKIELWDAMIQSLTPQQRDVYLNNVNRRVQQLKTARNGKKPDLAQKASAKR